MADYGIRELLKRVRVLQIRGVEFRVSDGHLQMKGAQVIEEDERAWVEANTEAIAEIVTNRVKPFIDTNGDLVIPLCSDPKYRWWQGGQSVRETLIELDAAPEVMRRYVSKN